MPSFDEKVSMCLENIAKFSDIINEIHNYDDIFKCDFEDCEIEMFSDELYTYVHSRRRSPRLAKNCFLGLWKKYPQALNNSFLIARNEKLF